MHMMGTPLPMPAFAPFEREVVSWDVVLILVLLLSFVQVYMPRMKFWDLYWSNSEQLNAGLVLFINNPLNSCSSKGSSILFTLWEALWEVLFQTYIEKFHSKSSFPSIVCKLGKPVTLLSWVLFVMVKSPPIVSRLGKDILARASQSEIRIEPPMLVKSGNEIWVRASYLWCWVSQRYFWCQSLTDLHSWFWGSLRYWNYHQ